MAEEPKKQPTPIQQLDSRDNSPEPVVSPPIRKRAQPAKSVKARTVAGNTEIRTTVEIHPQPSTSKQPLATVQENGSPGKYHLFNP